MKKSKRENLLSPSSSWRENHNPPRRNSNSSAVTSGCLPGFFNLFLSTFNFSSNRRKSITLGSKKREQRTVVYASPLEDSSNADDGGIVAPPLPRIEGEGDAARVSLVGALEKCDRDLEELRRTIDVIKTTYLLHKKLEVSQATAPARDNFKFSGTLAGGVVVGTPTNKNTKTTIHDTDTTMLSMMMNHHEYSKDNKTYKVNNINLITRPDHYNMHDVISERATSTETRGTAPIVVRKVRRSLMDSVNQVCDDVASGQRREVAKIGLALHDHICRDLIAETVHELSFSDYYDDDECHKSAVDSAVFFGGGSGRRHIRRGSTNSLPLDACRRRLVF